MAVRGVFASHNSIMGDRIGDLSSRVLMLGYTGSAPMLALSSGMPKESAADTAFNWTEDQHISGNTLKNGTQNSAATVLAVDDTSIWAKNSIVMNQTTGEYVFVVSVDSSTQITVLRGIGGTTAQQMTDNDVLQSVGTAFEEGGGKPESVTQRGETRTNYTQIFKNGWAITGTAKAVKFHTGSQLAYNRSNALGYHVEDIERAFLFGRPGVMVNGGKQLRMSGGIDYHIRTFGGLVTPANAGGAGQMNMDGVRHFMRLVFDRNVKGLPNERIAFTGSAVLELIQQMIQKDGMYQIHAEDTKYGIKIWKLQGFNGDLTLATHPLFTENSIWGHQLLVVHPGLVKKRVLRDTWEETFNSNNMNNNGIDAEEGYIALETGFQVSAVETMGIMTNIQTAVAS